MFDLFESCINGDIFYRRELQLFIVLGMLKVYNIKNGCGMV